MGEQACLNIAQECVAACRPGDDNCYCECAHLTAACAGWPTPPCHFSG
ncbi:hypothetical protein [Streptomyces sp. NPDC046887]